MKITMGSSPCITTTITKSAFKPYHAKQRLEDSPKMIKHLPLLSTEDEVYVQKIQDFVDGKMELFAREYELAKQVKESKMRKRESKHPMKTSSSDDELAKQVKESKKRKRESKHPMKSSSSDVELAKQVKESKKRKIASKHPLKRSSDDDEDEKKKKMKKMMKRKIQKEVEKRINSQPPVSNEVTERLKEFITNDLKGSDIKLVIQKLLYSSDIKSDQNRLSMPINQLEKSEFFTPQEKSFLDKRGEFDVQLLGPTLQMYKLPMRLMMWEMVSTQSYILKTNWYGFVKENKKDLKENSIIQMWSFRKDQQLCFALAVVEEPDPMFSLIEE